MVEAEAGRRWAVEAAEGRSLAEQHLEAELVLPAVAVGLAERQHSTAGSIARSCREDLYVSK